jgi:hypothetical protein
MKYTLKPCPFCGGKLKHNENKNQYWCFHEDCVISCVQFSYKKIEEWNTRPIEDKLAEQINLNPELVKTLKEVLGYIDLDSGRFDEEGPRWEAVLKKAGEL